uniref:Uncharacterized protein n=1 Tax=Ixodes ricinus TaxID=34613 RepID=A0A6B0V4A0_IXORI
MRRHLALLRMVPVFPPVRPGCPETAACVRGWPQVLRLPGTAKLRAALPGALHGLLVRRALVSVLPALRQRDPAEGSALRGPAGRTLDPRRAGGTLSGRRAAGLGQALRRPVSAGVAHVLLEPLLELVRWNRSPEPPSVLPRHRGSSQPRLPRVIQALRAPRLRPAGLSSAPTGRPSLPGHQVALPTGRPSPTLQLPGLQGRLLRILPTCQLNSRLARRHSLKP